MSRDYRIIKGGRFAGESFNVNVSGYMWLGALFKELGLPVSGQENFPQAPHEITGPVQSAILGAIEQPDFQERLADAIRKVRAANPEQAKLSTVGEDHEWVMKFLDMAKNPEGFASDYCEQYIEQIV